MIQVPDGWELKLSSELCKGIADGTHDTPQPSFFGFNLVTSKNLKDNKLDFEDCYLISEEDYIAINKRSQVKQYDILFGMIGTIGNPVIILNKNIDFAIKNVGLFRFNGDYELAKWFYYYLSSEQFKNYLDFVLAGSSQKFVSLGMLRTLPILIPKEKKEQEKIAKILSTLDNAIESTNRIIEKEKNIKMALMQELLTNGIDKNGQIRTSQTHIYKQSELGLIPDEWEVKALKSVGSCKNGLTYSPDDIVESDGVLVLRSSNIKNNKLTFSDNVFVREDMKINYKVQENDILICVRNGSKNLIGKNALITRESINMAHGAFMTVFHSNINEYVFQLFQSDLFFKQVEKNLGATINSINNSDLLLFDFSFPKDEIEQKQITKILTTQDKKIETEEKNLAKLKELKKGLMNDLLSGVVRVNV